MKNFSLIVSLLLIISITSCISIIKRAYLPTRDKLIAAEEKIALYEKKIEEYRYAEIQTAQTIQKLQEKISHDKESLDWSREPIPAPVLNVLRDAHKTATSRYAPSDRMSQNSKN